MSKDKKVGEIYILTNPSFPEWVKIGYSDDADNRAKQLSNSSAVPFSFHVYATYDVFERLDDTKLHNLIDGINPDLRSIEKYGDKTRKREFYHIQPEEIYSALESWTAISGTSDRLHLRKETSEETEEKAEAAMLSKTRHHFKNIEFHSSLTNKDYYSRTNNDGTLGVYEKATDKEVPNNANPSKRKILLAALEDLGGDMSGSNTLYQLQHKLEKILRK